MPIREKSGFRQVQRPWGRACLACGRKERGGWKKMRKQGPNHRELRLLMKCSVQVNRLIIFKTLLWRFSK